MDAIDLLNRERAKAEKERAEVCAPFDAAIAEFDAAIAAIKERRRVSGSQTTDKEGPAEKPTIDDAIVQAVKNGRRAPVAILDFLAQQMGVQTTINSIRTRVSRLKGQGRLAHDARGWILPDEEPDELPLGPRTETAPTSINGDEAVS